uniref:Uncharacterized protein n=1 Tax=Human herpesvirus 2 TaxID=10310 RepID=A0A481T656_HHV2|nr:hypothetical protein [Human alphaherpesvirus 2]QBH82406.1 hypothetical protein [Human alphaherpesvirus 2]QBH83739.1 hypothetical protein [Human alphaherpesvirus 2]
MHGGTARGPGGLLAITRPVRTFDFFSLVWLARYPG